MCLVHAEAGQAEVAHFDAVVVVDEEIVRLDVAMHDRRLPVMQVEDACSRLQFPLSTIPPPPMPTLDTDYGPNPQSGCK